MKNDKVSPFGASSLLQIGSENYTLYKIKALEQHGLCTISILPFSIRILLENLVRHCNSGVVKEDDVVNLASWHPVMHAPGSIPFMPGRVVLQDFT